MINFLCCAVLRPQPRRVCEDQRMQRWRRQRPSQRAQAAAARAAHLLDFSMRHAISASESHLSCQLSEPMSAYANIASMHPSSFTNSCNFL